MKNLFKMIGVAGLAMSFVFCQHCHGRNLACALLHLVQHPTMTKLLAKYAEDAGIDVQVIEGQKLTNQLARSGKSNSCQQLLGHVVFHRTWSL